MATNRAAVRRMMGSREGFVDELSHKDQAKMRALHRKYERTRKKEKAGDFLKAYGTPLAIGTIAVLALLYLKKREKDKAAVVGSIMLHA